MANPPTYVGTTNSTVAWPGNNTDAKTTGSVLSGSAGDILVVLSGDFNLTTQSFAASSSPSETWTNNTKTGGSNNADSLVQTATAVLAANRSGMSVTSTRSPAQSSLWNFVVAQFSGSDGVGANAATTGNGQGAVSLTITTQYDNSAIVYMIMDWSDDGNAARTHRTPSGGSTPIEIGHFNNSSDGSATWAYIADAGAAGAKVVGMSAPTGRDQVMAAVEVRGTVNIGPSFDDASFDSASFYTADATPVTKTYANTWNITSSVSKTYSNTWNLSSSINKTASVTWNADQSSGSVLMAEYGFHNNLQDSSGNNVHASASGGFTPTYVTGPQSGTSAARFNGTGQSIIYGRQPALYPSTKGITVMGWFRLPASGWPGVLIGGFAKARNSNASTRAGFYFTEAGRFRPLSRWKDSLYFSDSLGSPLNDGTWHHYTIVDGNGRSEWYVDGVTVGDTELRGYDNTPFDISSEAFDWRSGDDSALALSSYNGMEVSGIRVFHGELTDAEVTEWMNTPVSAPNLTPVTKTYSNTWNARSTVTSTYSSIWNAASVVSKSYSSTWSVFASISKTYASTWNVAGAPVDTISIYDAIEATAPTNATSDDAAVNLGTEFYVTSQAWVTALRWYQPVGNSPSSSNRTLGIFRVDSASTGTLVAGPVTSTPSGSGWQTVDLETPYELTANQRYRVVVLHPNGRYGSTSFTFNGGSNLVQDFITAPNTANATGNDNGSYFYGSSLAFTNDSFNSTYYWSDALITATNPIGTSTVTKTAPITWNTNSDLVASYFPSDIGSPWSVGPAYTDPDTNAKFGISFAVSSSCEIGGARWYSPVAKSGVAVTLNDYDSLTVYKTQQNYDVVVGWNELLFDEPFVASPGTTYVLGVWQPGPVEYTYTDSDLWGGTVSHGSIYTTHTSATRYRYNSSFDAPIGSGAGGSSSRWAGMDVVELLPVEDTFDPTFGSTVALENAKSGTPSDNWMITGAGDTTNIGFTGKYHYDKAVDTAIDFRCHGTGTKISIYRVGFYQGHGARKVAELTNTATTQSSASTISSSEGSIEFDWSTTATWTIPSDALSGFYFAYYHNTAETNGSWIPFVLADRDRTASMAYKTSDFTWYGAYNYCGDLGSILTGKSVYGSGGPLGSITSRHFIGSYHRPCVTREGVPQTYWMNSESSMIMFLEEQGIDVKYTSCIGLDQGTSGLTNINMLLSNGHDEYWSDGMTNNVQALRDTEGVNLVFMTGNENFWRVFWDHTNKRMTCRKDTMSGPGAHVAGVPFIDEANWTGTWRDTRWSLRRPENETTGTYFDMNGVLDKTLVVDAATYGSHTAWRDTTVATGTNLSLPRVVGFEADSYVPTQPSGAYTLLAAQTFNIDGSKADANGEVYNLNGNMNYGIIAQRFPSSVVVGFGTCQWSWALIGTHDRTATSPSNVARQMTLNLLTDLGAPPTTTATGLITPTPQSLDNYGVAPLTAVTKNYSTSWNVRQAVTATDAVDWDVNAVVSNSYAVTWNQRAVISKSVSVEWNVAGSLFTVNKTSASTWNINAGITPKTASFTWTVNTLVNKSYAPTWNVNNVVSKTYNLTWNDRQAVSTSKATSWNILSGVTAKTYANTWNINQSINKTYAVAWNARTAVTKAYAQLWNTFAIGSVSKAYQVNWNVIAKVSSGNSQLWNVRTALVKSYAQAWAVNQAVLKSYANAWNVRAIAAKFTQFSWNVFQVASNQTNFNWEVYSLVNKNTLSSWSVRARVIKESEAQWVVRQVVNNETEFEWDIFITAARQYSSNWIVSGGVIKQYNTTWNVNEDNKWYVKEPDGTFTLLSIAGIWNGTQVVPV